MRRLVLCFSMFVCGAGAVVAEVLTYETPWYRIGISTDPAAVVLLEGDPSGTGNYQPLLKVDPETVSLAETPAVLAGKQSFSEFRGGMAEGMRFERPYGVEILLDVQLVSGLRAEWKFLCYERGFEYQLNWIVEQEARFKNLGHQWFFPFPVQTTESGRSLKNGDTPNFHPLYFVRKEFIVLKLDPVFNTTNLKGGVYKTGKGIVFNNIIAPKQESLLPGIYPGGRWVCEFVTPAGIGPEAVPQNMVAEYHRTGEYMKDFFPLVHEGDVHLFYNVGKAGPKQRWQDAGNEDRFGHAVSRDLKTWERKPDILPLVPQSWEGEVVSAPCIVKHKKGWAMMYTGFDDRVRGCQRNGLAYSSDLYEWVRYEDNPVYEGPAWTTWSSVRGADCRDPYVLNIGRDGAPEYLMFSTVYQVEPRIGAVAIAKSKDLIQWKDLGPGPKNPRNMESVLAFQRNGWTYLIITGGGRCSYMTRDPENGPWFQFPWKYPTGHWSAYELMTWNGKEIISAFEWKTDGNRIAFWELKWDVDIPFVDY